VVEYRERCSRPENSEEKKALLQSLLTKVVVISFTMLRDPTPSDYGD